MTLSVDSIYTPNVITVRTKSFTVPLGTVLKISGGQISMSGQNSGVNFRLTTGFIKIDNNLILGADSLVTNAVSSFNGVYWRSTYRITPDKPIWAPGGATVVLGVDIQSTAGGTSAFLASNWITGVIYRKVAN
ncbi:MAG: hypothetical protein IPP73_06305 [Chitinophagaceae bacterium]|nr:hypothetical protein [Chitinophagaceae bacterium]